MIDWPAYFFTQKPLLILAIGLILAAYAYTRRRLPGTGWFCGLSAFAWLAYSAWETYLWFWRSPTGDMAIRVDALFIEPTMQLLLLANLILMLWNATRQS